MNKFFLVLLCTWALSWMACNNPPNEASGRDTLFELKENTGINFINNLKDTKDFNIFSYRNFYNGGGVALGDINNDSLPDVFFTANMGSNQLYLNKGNWRFEDISKKAGIEEKENWSTGVVMVDINNDGWLDIYVCNAGYINGMAPESKLFINNHDLTFTEAAKNYGLSNTGGYATHVAFFDYDADGDLDCYLLNNSFIPVNTLNYSNKRELRAEDWPVADFLKGGGDKLLQNNNGKFRDVSKEAGIYGSLIGFGLGVTVGDVNGDHYPDIYVSNDFFERDYLYINNRNGSFSEQLESQIQHISHSSMGADMNDINNDGFPDIFVTEMLPGDDYRLKTTTSFENTDVQKLKQNSGFYNQFMQNTLQVNNGNGKFRETAFYSGVAATDWSWGALLFDADNDGLADIYVCNGIYHDVTDQDFIDFFANDIIQKMVMSGEKEEVDNIINKMRSRPIPNKMFKNKGELSFSDVGNEWGLATPSFSNGAAYADLDNDGDLDLVVNNVNQKAFVYQNKSREQNANNYISFRLKGNKNNLFGIGASIKVYRGAQIITRELIPTRGFQSSIDYKMVIGLGKATADSVHIVWPDFSITRLISPAINTTHEVIQQAGEKWQAPATAGGKIDPILKPVSSGLEKHQEDDFIDAYYDKNIPLFLSREGPKAAHGDVNGDGLEDLYIGGAANQPGQLYIQTASGFVKKIQKEFELYASFEDVAALFFDADGDKDLDLLVGSGGNNTGMDNAGMVNRLYKNDGKDGFTLQRGVFPATGNNTSAIIAHDFDGDNDLDLFIGGRSISQNYGPGPQSYIYVNDGQGNFIDKTAELNSDIRNIGLVTGAVWADITGDGKKELVIVGEWMQPRIFQYTNGRMQELNTGLESLKGWWQTVAASDLDGDGDEDLILGNIGENFYLRPTDKTPVKLWVNDFDNNGTTDKIVTYTIDGKDKTVFLKRELTDQIVSLKKQNLKHSDFANKSLQELFMPDELKNAVTREFNYPASCIAFNNGKGQFSVEKLPLNVQLSSVNAIACFDLNKDGKKDIILGGNKFDWLPQFCRLDAGLGTVLINKGNKSFEELSTIQSGLSLTGEIKDIQIIAGRSKEFALILRNNDVPALYQISSVDKR